MSILRKPFVFLLVMGALFGIVCIIPAAIIRFSATSGFRGIEMSATDSEVHYAARVREVMDGAPRLANVFYADGKDGRYLQPPLPEIVVALLGKMFFLDAARALLLSQFLFGAGVFIAAGGFFWSVTRRFWLSLLAVSLVFFVGFIFSDLKLVFNIFHGVQPDAQFLIFARTINPQWSLMLFFGALWALAEWHTNGRRIWLAVATVFMALSVYSYLYTWTFLFVFFGTLFILEFRAKDRARIRDMAVAGVVLAMATLPYVFNVIQTTQIPDYPEVSMRFGMLTTRAPIFGVVIVALLILWPFLRWTFPQKKIFFDAFVFASLVALNQQIITGKTLAPVHYHWFIVKPLTLIFFLLLLGVTAWDNRPKKLQLPITKILIIPTVLVFCIGYGVFYQIRSAQNWLVPWSNAQLASGVLIFLDAHARPGDVSYVDASIRDIVPIYTSSDVYSATHAIEYPNSDARALDTYFFDLWLADIAPEEAAKQLRTIRRGELSGRVHGAYYHIKDGRYDAIPDEEVEDVIRSYAAYFVQPLDAVLAKYRITYFVFDRAQPSTPQRDALKQKSKQIYQDDAYEVWELISGEALK